MNSFNFKNNLYTSKDKKTKLLLNKELYKNIDDVSISQLKDIQQLPNINYPIIGLPDIHRGFGVPIGSVFASNHPNGIISSLAVGYDINCGIRVIKTNIFLKDLNQDTLKNISSDLKKLPIGLSSDGLSLKKNEFLEILKTGIDWSIKKGYEKKDSKYKISYNGSFKDIDTKKIPKLAIEKGIKQIGTLGLGNHFIDLLVVDEVFNNSLKTKYNLKKNQILIMIHTGSRGFGFSIAKHFNDLFTYKKPFSYEYINSKLGKEYYNSMLAAANFAFVNRSILGYKVLDVISKNLNKKLNSSLLYDIVHNLATIEKHNSKKLIIHRKGATFAPHKSDLDKSSVYKNIGIPVIIPGSMLSKSYIVNVNKQIKDYYNTLPHGIGRVLNRSDAKKEFSSKELKEFMLKNKVFVDSKSENNLREEQPYAYKDSNQVINCLTDLKIVKKVVSLKPILVILG